MTCCDLRRSWFGRLLRTCLMLSGGVALLLTVLAFTRIPFDAHRWLGTAGGLAGPQVEAILVLSGSGMPSGPELMRCQEAAKRAAQAPAAGLLLALPYDTALARAMVQELGLRGVAPERITLVMHGRNTREQALDVATTRPAWKARSIAVVTAPEHMYRSLCTFRKLGFARVAGAPAFEHALFSNLAFNHTGAGGKAFTPDISASTDLRYNFWNYLKLEITCLREYAALLYYQLNGWI
ncbi:MAG: YdcF family protein [Flavobacteriales bacterium]|nr:YdcF family protein [Flavobacteriales bacterium]